MSNLKNETFTDPNKMLGLENYVKCIQELQNSGQLDLNKLHELSYAEKNDVFQEILRWGVFGKRDLKKLKTTPPTYNI
ncbi:MAG: hypothetical protein EBQ70_02590 [Betaproteobacteria bacterium]|jgi:hypothetical protein|nr:hypothetical protein [Betaproteobacteria bacterium]